MPDYKWGYIDPNGTFVIPPIYDFATSFHNGIASCDLDGKSRFISKDGATQLKTHRHKADGIIGSLFNYWAV